MSEWISVKDRLPMVGQLVLVSDANVPIHDRAVFVAFYFHETQEWWAFDKSFPVTHWTPLPEPPNA
jgi:hypothetical protein